MAKQATTDILTIDVRGASGTAAAKAARREGLIPGVLYGHGEPTAVTVSAKLFNEVVIAGHHKTGVLAANIGGARESVLLRAVQRDPVTRRALHVDFQRVTGGEAVTATVPVTLVGESKAVKNGALLDVVTREIDIKGPAGRIPEQIELDVTDLALGHNVTAGALRLPAGFTLATPPEAVIVTVEVPPTQRALAEISASDTQNAEAQAADAAAESPAADGASAS